MDTIGSTNNELATRIQGARNSVLSSPNFNLDIRGIMRILALFGPSFKSGADLKTTPSERIGIVGWQRRAWNSILCAEYVAPFCGHPAIEVDIPAAINLMKHAVRDGIPQIALGKSDWISTDDLWLEYIDEIKTSKATYQAMTALLVIDHAMIIVEHDIDAVFDPGLDYFDFVQEEHEQTPTALYAANVVGGDLNSEALNDQLSPFLDDNARRTFWMWWINDAVPASWNLVDVAKLEKRGHNTT